MSRKQRPDSGLTQRLSPSTSQIGGRKNTQLAESRGREGKNGAAKQIDTEGSADIQNALPRQFHVGIGVKILHKFSGTIRVTNG